VIYFVQIISDIEKMHIEGETAKGNCMEVIVVTFRRILLGIFVAIFLWIPLGVIAGGDEPAIPFIDRDGDGFNDNSPDSDGDGIPDAADPDFKGDLRPETNVKSAPIDFAGGFEAAGIEHEYLAGSEKYGRLKFTCRALMQNRCAFTSEENFGSGAGIGIGSSGGGACAGGVCH
jgi:hypothetical protein